VSDLLRQKALRLPLMLVGLMVMAWVIQSFRPHVEATPRPYRDPSSVTLLEPVPASNMANTPSLQRPLLSLQKPATWTLEDIAAISKQGSKTVLMFADGSSRDVTPTLLSQLPSALQTRVSYDRSQP
jgi:hypothetical protein